MTYDYTPNNEARAYNAAAALEYHKRRVKSAASHHIGLENLIDLLTDLRHWAGGINSTLYDAANKESLNHYNAERMEEHCTRDFL